ncbi:hypothetical protein [Pseudogracilibacillus sp. SO30301A]|uniref:hypothetical protein n=1 Tax=Pseudogracilibacillus sp. SO30301A TaxID=3098291 RepID=UPI00300DFA0E
MSHTKEDRYASTINFCYLLFSGCNGQKIDGYIMGVNENSFLLAEGATEEEASRWLETYI